MKKYFFSFLVALMALSAVAQPSDDKAQRREQIKALKIAYFTEQLGLTPSESEKFWPLYNQYWAERRDMAHRKRDVLRGFEAGGATKAIVAQYFDSCDADVALQRRYAEQFMTILTPEKVAKLLSAEESFKFVILKKSGIHK